MRADLGAAFPSGAFAPPQALAEGGDILFSAVEGSPMPMFLVDPHRPGEPIVFANAAFSRLTGYGPTEILGRDCRFLQGPGSDLAAAERIRHAIASRTSLSAEILNYRKDGTPFRSALSLSPVFGGDGSLAYFLASQVEVSASRPAGQEPALAASAEGPADGLAHDLRNMLQVIAGSMDVIARQAESSGDARLIRRVGAVVEAAARATALGDALAAVARGRTSDLHEGPASPERQAVSGPKEAGAGGRRVLVVDDRAEIAELARTMLEAAGYRVEVAGDGEAALDRLSVGFDLLFTDLVMPGALDGLGLAQAAKRRHPDLQVLLTTGDAPRAAAQAGAFAAIVKPYRRADLVAAVRRLLDGPPQPALP